MSLQSQISKTVVEYIDTAITTPPLHRPFEDADVVYDRFVRNYPIYIVGIDMKQVYERKHDDPSYLPFDNFAINLARLFLAARARDQVSTRCTAPLSLDSVDFKTVSAKAFRRILFLIANANERASSKKIRGDSRSNNRSFDRAYEVFKTVVASVDMLQPYTRRSDDPHWLERYSNQAINIVRLLLAIHARSASARTQGRTAPVPSLDSVDLRNVAHDQFLDTLNGLLHKSEIAQRQARNSNTPTARPLQGPSADVESGSDTCFEPETEWEATSETGISDDSNPEPSGDLPDDTDNLSDDVDPEPETLFEYMDNLSDISTDDEVDTVPAADMSDDELSEFDSEEDYQREFSSWLENEADEALPQDVIGPLLDSSDKETLRITIELLEKTLGIAKAPIAKMKQKVNSVLRELRRLYRIAHTRPWRYSSVPEYKGTCTFFIQSYSVISDTTYMLRSFATVIFKTPADAEPELADKMVATFKPALKELRMGLKHLPAMLEDLPDCHRIISERTRIARIRLNAYFDAVGHCTIILGKYGEAFTIKGPSNMPRFNVKERYSVELLTAVQNFKAFDDSKLDKESFPEFPTELIRGCKILRILRDVHKLKYISEFRKNEDMKKAANIAGDLLRKWHQRSLGDTKNSLFVTL